jgi:heme/copper-type cytochrome/quinol oxidase subunit 2
MTYQLIILYIIIIITLVFLKPAFLYDNEKQQYKEFGTGENQTLFTLPSIAIILAIIIAIIAMSFKIKSIINTTKNNSNLNANDTNNMNYKFIPVPVYYQQPMVQVPFNQMSPVLTQQLGQQMKQMQSLNQPAMPITQPINVNQTGGQYMVTPEMFLNML